MCRLLHVSHACGIGLVMWRLERYTQAPMGDHDGNAIGGYLFTSITHSPQSSMGHVVSLELP
jgi:hypothetical protein